MASACGSSWMFLFTFFQFDNFVLAGNGLEYTIHVHVFKKLFLKSLNIDFYIEYTDSSQNL